MVKPLFTGSEWTFDLLNKTYEEIEKIGVKELGLNLYPNQIEIITSEQMVDAYCIAPDHTLLRSDLRWVQAGDIEVGNVVLGFDENLPDTGFRKYRKATVLSKVFQQAEIFEVNLSSGKTFRVTGNHQWLVRKAKGKASILVWKSTTELYSLEDFNKPGAHSQKTVTRLGKVIHHWNENDTKDAGWLAGIFDGEGNICNGFTGHLGFAQKPGLVLDRAADILTKMGVRFTVSKKNNSGDCRNLNILGTRMDRLELLGKIRPERLIDKIDFEALRTVYLCQDEIEDVLSVKSVGIGTIVKISTSTGTFVCDGYLMHNSSNGMPVNYGHWSFGKRFIRDWDSYKKGQSGLAYEIVLNCLNGESKVITPNGIVSLNDIEIGNTVWDGKKFVGVTHKKTSIQEAFRIEMGGGLRLEATAEHVHHICTPNGFKSKKTSELTIDDWFIIPPKAEENGHQMSLRDFGHHYLPPRCGYGEKYNHQVPCTIPEFMTEDLAELIGIIIGDGCFGHGSMAFYIATGHDAPEYKDHVIKLIEKVFGVVAMTKDRESTRHAGKFNTDVIVCSNAIKQFLIYCGINNKCTFKDKRIPWAIWESDNICKAAFMRGMFDTDGCVKSSHGKPNSMNIVCYNEDFGKDMSVLLWSLGIAHSNKRRKNGVDREIQAIDIVSDGRRKFAAIIGSNHFQKKTKMDLLLSRKKSPYENDFAEVSRLPDWISSIVFDSVPATARQCGSISRGQALKFSDNSLLKNRYVKVHSVDKIGEIQVVDITVDSEDHLFWCNGVLTHNCSPTIAYLMESNSMTMQALVMAHAGVGHNHVFKNNYLFKQWTDAEAIIDYLLFAKNYIAKCEEKEGRAVVEKFLDSCHALMDYGINRYKRPGKLSKEALRQREEDRLAYLDSQVSELDRILPKKGSTGNSTKSFPEQPEENLLYFCEKYSPKLKTWQREVIRIVRKISEYFHPQMQTKTLNEAGASITHYKIMHRLHEKGLITDGSMLEFMSSHAGVVYQPPFDSPYYSGMNPYKLGFEMLMDIERICKNPTDEDRAWFPDLIGQEPFEAVKECIANYRDESMIRQFLSPKLIRDFGFFHLHDDSSDEHYTVKAIHNEKGYHTIREKLADQYERENMVPTIEVIRVDPVSRELTLVYRPFKGKSLSDPTIMLRHVKALWGFEVSLRTENGHYLGTCK
jgi:stage V sporulation protein R